MTQEKRKFEDWLDYARKAKRVALLAHISPDGDTLGSTLALRLAFLAMGKQVDVICDGDVPDNLKFLTGSESILHPEDVNESDYDTAIAVDVSDRSLLVSLKRCLTRRESAWSSTIMRPIRRMVR